MTFSSEREALSWVRVDVGNMWNHVNLLYHLLCVIAYVCADGFWSIASDFRFRVAHNIQFLCIYENKEALGFLGFRFVLAFKSFRQCFILSLYIFNDTFSIIYP